MSNTNKQSQVQVLNLIETLGYGEALLFTKQNVDLRSAKSLSFRQRSHPVVGPRCEATR